MAFQAGHILVFPVKFEFGFIMIECFHFPCHHGMASQAIGGSILFELPVMIVFMAVRTSGSQPREPLDKHSRGILDEMTNPAAFPGMSADKVKPGKLMVKFNIRPCRRVMAGIAVVVGIILFIQVTDVNVFMAIGTLQPNVFKAPFILLLMTGETGCCKMRILQFECPCIMLLHGERCIPEAKCCMTGRAIGTEAILRQLTFMVILMAIGTFCMFHRIGHIVFMA